MVVGWGWEGAANCLGGHLRQLWGEEGREVGVEEEDGEGGMEKDTYDTYR